MICPDITLFISIMLATIGLFHFFLEKKKNNLFFPTIYLPSSPFLKVLIDTKMPGLSL